MELSEATTITVVVNKDSVNDGDREYPHAETQSAGGESVVDISGGSWDVIPQFADRSHSWAESLYVYRNTFNLIPRSIGEFPRLKTLKFFANEMKVLPLEAGDLVELESLRVKVASPGMLGLPIQRMKALQELELCLMPPRLSALKVLTDISGLKCLTKLSVCHFSIRYLPPEIGCLEKLEDLDLSFNKLKSLPNDISALSALKSLRVANNKLIELPPGLSNLRSLKKLDFSNNRLTSLKSIDFDSMTALETLDLQYNKLPVDCQVPSWICCNLEGNSKDSSTCDSHNLLEEDAFDAAIHRSGLSSCSVPASCCNISSDSMSETSSIARSSVADRMRQGWRRRDLLQQRTRQERLSTIRKWRSEDHHEIITEKMSVKCNPCKRSLSGNRSSKLHSHSNEKKHAYCSSSIKENSKQSSEARGLDDDCNEKKIESESESLHSNVEDERNISITCNCGDVCSCIFADSASSSQQYQSVCYGDYGASSPNSSKKSDGQDVDSSEVSKHVLKFKRHSDGYLDNPKPTKCLRPFDICNNLSCKYSMWSICCSNDRLPDGFYDAGRDRPFMSLQHYDQNLCLDSREVILVDRKRDEDLDAVLITAQRLLVCGLKQSRNSSDGDEVYCADDFRRASLLALFVSDYFGGSDRSNTIVGMRKFVSGSNYDKPFVCTCATGNNFHSTEPSKVHDNTEEFNFDDLCEKSLRFIKERRNSNIVPIGTLRFGVCRHRALLMKYLCDRVDPPILCELVRGYLDFTPHAWNVVLVRRGSSLVRMVVDACHPTDIREESDPEFFCRYIPLACIHFPVPTEDVTALDCSFTSLIGDGLVNTASKSVIQCKLGTTVAAAKLKTLDVNGTSNEEIRNFEYKHLGEVRILGALRNHPCIVEIYGQQLSSNWIPATEGVKEHRLLQSAIIMEFINGGSLKKQIDKFAKRGAKYVPVKLALFIARDIAFALSEVHSRHIIHRDVKSENILIDLDSKRVDGSPVVKLCDFDRAVPLNSYLHKCCIAHSGIHPPDVCVGTPRWMAPEVIRAMHSRHQYGLEVDIWSYGCVLLELLTLQVPYAGLSDSEFQHQRQMDRRPRLTEELEALVLSNESSLAGSEPLFLPSLDSDTEMLKFLVNLFIRCTDGNPSKRPTAIQVHDMLCSVLAAPDQK